MEIIFLFDLIISYLEGDTKLYAKVANVIRKDVCHPLEFRLTSEEHNDNLIAKMNTTKALTLFFSNFLYEIQI